MTYPEAQETTASPVSNLHVDVPLLDLESRAACEPWSSHDLVGAQKLGSNRVGRERRVHVATQAVQSPQLEPSLQIGTVDTLRCQLSNLTTDEQLQLCGELFSQICSSQPAHTVIPLDFMSLSLKAMDNLKASGRRNVLYELALGLGSLRPDGTPLFPMDRMPMGLLEYMVNFFTSSNISEVSVSVINL